MPKKFFLIRTAFLILFILQAFPLPANAQNGHQNSWSTIGFLFDYARTLYERGDFANARYEFNTLLVIDPGNNLARDYLKKMGLPAPAPEAPPAYARGLKLQKENLHLKAALAKFREEIINKSVRIAELERQAELLNAGIEEYQQKAGELQGRLRQYLAEAAAKTSRLMAVIQKKEVEAAILSERIKKEEQAKRLLEDESRNKEREIAELEALNRLELEMAAAALNARRELEREAAGRRLMDKELELAAKDRQIEGLNSRLHETRLRLEQAEKEKAENGLWIEQLNKRIKQLEEASGEQLARYLEKLNSLEDRLRAKEDELDE